MDEPRGGRAGPARDGADGVAVTQPLAFAIHGPIAQADLPGLCDRVCALLQASSAPVALCDVDGVAADAVTVDALARLQLAAGRHGCRIRLLSASAELSELVALMGLTDVVAGDATR